MIISKITVCISQSIADAYFIAILPSDFAIIFYPVSIRPAAGCKYILTIRPALSVLHSSGGLAARVGAQAGFATSRTLGCAQAGFATSRTLGCAQVGFATSWTLGLGLGFGIDFGTIAIDLNT